MSELSPEQKNVTVDPMQRYVETASEITAFLTALEEQIRFLRVIASQKAIDSEIPDQKQIFVGVDGLCGQEHLVSTR